jgi:hypothetical protein
MKPRLLGFLALALAVMILAIPSPGRAQTVSVFPDQVPNGVASLNSEAFHQRFTINLGATATASSRAITIVFPSEFNYVSNSATSITDNTPTTRAVFIGYVSSTTDKLVFALSPAAGVFFNREVTIEFDVTTPTNFTGVTNGTARDTAYVVQFSSDTNQANQDADVAKHQNLRLQTISFASPDSTLGDTTAGAGRFYKIEFPGALPDLSHTQMSGLSPGYGTTGSAAPADDATDVLYSFYLSTQPNLVKQPLGLPEMSVFSLAVDRSPISGQRQNPAPIDRTFIRENYVTLFQNAAVDSVNGMVSLAGTAHATDYYIYLLADPAPGRDPATNLNVGAAKKGFSGATRGAFTGRTFLGRSGGLHVLHPPEFVVAGWDYDDDGNDAFTLTGIIQVPSDMPSFDATIANNRKDNANITVDSGKFEAKGATLTSLNSGLTPPPVQTVPMLFIAEDIDNTGTYSMNVFLSTQSGLTDDDFTNASPDIDELDTAIRIPGTDTLSLADRSFSFDPVIRDTTTGLITSFIPEEDYFVYYAATDGVSRTLYQVQDDPFRTSPQATTISVRHSPLLRVDEFALNDFGGDGDLDVITGIGVTQMQTSVTGLNLKIKNAQRRVNISWGSTGIDGDLDVDDSATIDLYYSTRSDFKFVGGSAAWSNSNSDGSDLLNAVIDKDTDTHLLASNIQEDPDGQFDNQYAWDLWSFSSPEGTVPQTGIRYYIYGLLTGGTTRRLISLTDSGFQPGQSSPTAGTSQAIVFEHPPYVRGLEPSRDITVTVSDPVSVTWEAADVDNAEGFGAAVPSNGRSAPNSRSDSPNIRILLTSGDFGEVTTWASISNAAQTVGPLWLANSGDGQLATEIELNEGVDTSFVFTGNRMRNDLGFGATSASRMGTNGGLGRTYNVYLAIDGGDDGVVAALGAFTAFSPVVKVPGTITFTGVVPASPVTAVTFVVPQNLSVTESSTFKVPIAPNDGPVTKTVRTVNLFLSVDPARFTPVDMDASEAGIQPFTLGASAQIQAGNVDQAAYLQGGLWRIDFAYDDQVGAGLTFFDGQNALAVLNLKPAPTGGATVTSTISVDNTATRKSTMLEDVGSGTVILADAGVAIPAPVNVDIKPRATVTGTVKLQGRTVSADTVTVFLREVGSGVTVTDSLFEADNDLVATKTGVQVATTGPNGDFELLKVPAGRYVLTASVPRHLTGQDTLVVIPGLDVAGVSPTKDGDGVDRAELLAGDAAGYQDSTGSSIPDNVIDNQDLNSINAALFASLGDADYNTYADINRDNVVNIQDRSFATQNQSSNTGAAGKIKPVFPTFKKGVLEGDNTQAKVMLDGVPQREVRRGETFDVTVRIQDARYVHGYEVHLAYDPAKLAVIDVANSGSLLQDYLFTMTSKIHQDENGTYVGLANSIIGDTPVGASGDAELGTVRFQAIGRNSDTDISLANALLVDVEIEAAHPLVDGSVHVMLKDGAVVYHDRDGALIKGLILAEADPKVDFNDFLALAGVFGAREGDADFDFRADLNVDRKIDFADFLIFVQNFGRTAVDAPSVRLTKPMARPGVNEAAELRLGVSGQAKIGEDLTLVADLAKAESVKGWGITVSFDPSRYEFVNASAPEAGLLASGGSEPLFLVQESAPGQVTVSSALTEGSATGSGSLAVLTFRPKGEIDDARFDILEGVVFDADLLSNSMNVDALDVRPVPGEFALHQNFPNPFNPETTIAYDLAAGSRVELSIYNVTGQVVRTLVSEEQQAGRYRIQWSGDDAFGRQVASGIYFYRIQTESTQAVRKLMLLK